MYNTMLQVHSWFAYVVVVVLFLATANAVIGFFGKKEYTAKDLKLSLYGLIVSHIQLLVGVILYVTSPLFGAWKTSNVMGDSYLRKILLEHPMMVVIGVVLITVGWSLHKKQLTDNRTFGKIAIFYALGLACILSRIPWQNWF